MEERLQKIIAGAGVASRRHAEQLIVSGQVAVNGRVVTELGTKADPERDHIRVGGKLIRRQGKKIHIVLHKPDGVVATMSDPEGRTTIADLVRGAGGRVYPVGRLEYHASGLVLLTNDGNLANRVLRARGIEQTYYCKVSAKLNEVEAKLIGQRVGARLRPARKMPEGWWEVTTQEASSNGFRRALLARGCPVDKMKRVKLANLELGPIAPGEYRHLTREEVTALEAYAARAVKAGVLQGSEMKRESERGRVGKAKHKRFRRAH